MDNKKMHKRQKKASAGFSPWIKIIEVLYIYHERLNVSRLQGCEVDPHVDNSMLVWDLQKEIAKFYKSKSFFA